MRKETQHGQVLIMASDGFEQSELFVPLEKAEDRRDITSISPPPKQGEIRGWTRQ